MVSAAQVVAIWRNSLYQMASIRHTAAISWYRRSRQPRPAEYGVGHTIPRQQIRRTVALVLLSSMTAYQWQPALGRQSLARQYGTRRSGTNAVHLL